MVELSGHVASLCVQQHTGCLLKDGVYPPSPPLPPILGSHSLD